MRTPRRTNVRNRRSKGPQDGAHSCVPDFTGHSHGRCGCAAQILGGCSTGAPAIGAQVHKVLNKEEGAIRLVGGDNEYEGKDMSLVYG